MTEYILSNFSSNIFAFNRESLEKMKINLSSHVSEGGDNSTSCRSIGDETPTDTSKNLIPSLELSERIKLMKLLDR